MASDPLSQNVRLDFTKYSSVKWNGIFYFNSEIPVSLGISFQSESGEARGQMPGQMERKIPIGPVQSDNWVSFSETFPVRANRSIQSQTKISGNFGWKDRNQYGYLFSMTWYKNSTQSFLLIFNRRIQRLTTPLPVECSMKYCLTGIKTA